MPQTPPDFDPAMRARVWSDYWASGTQHSCAGSFSGNYAGNIAAFWRSVFALLPSDARVLDACCGNAPLGRLLLESDVAERVSELVAVDAAQIAPVFPAEYAGRVSVHAGVDVAALPFPDGGFDLCMSQYGIEYVGVPAFVECGRMLREGGRLAAVLHHVQALPVRIAREECGHIDVLLGDEGFFARARAMIEPMARAATEAGRAALMRDTQANAARAALNEALRALQARIDAALWPDVLLEQRDAVMQLLGQVPGIGAQAAHQHLEALQRALLASQLRQRELVAFALDEAGLRALMEAFPGRIERLEPLSFDNGELAGWALVACRTGSV